MVIYTNTLLIIHTNTLLIIHTDVLNHIMYLIQVRKLESGCACNNGTTAVEYTMHVRYKQLTSFLILHRLPPGYLVNNGSAINYRAVLCDGTEATLSQCSHSTNITGCNHTYDAAVVCRQS